MESETYVSMDEQVSFTYNNSTVIGVLSYDTVEIAGFSAVNQSFMLAYSSDFNGLEADGLVGLAFSSVTESGPTVIETLKSQGLIEAAVFSVYLSDDDSSAEGNESALVVGGYDLAMYGHNATERDIRYLDVLPQSVLWEVALDSVKFGDHLLSYGASSAVFDTGASMLLGPGALVASLFAFMNERYSCKFDKNTDMLICGCNYGYPDLVFELEGEAFYIPPSSYFRKVLGHCVLLINSVEATTWTLGSVFLRNYYSIYDFDQQRVGLVDVSSQERAGNHVSWFVFFIVGSALAALALLGAVFLIKRYKGPRESVSVSYIALTNTE